MATAKWFDYETYMGNKLAQLKAGDATWTMDKLVKAFADSGFVGAEGAQRHFEMFGQTKEDLSPNALFNVKEYYVAKAAQSYGKAVADVTELEAATVKTLIAKDGMTAWTHYKLFGIEEGVNPSNSFDTSAYMAAKLAAVQAAEPDKNWTAESLQKAFSDARISALEHFMMYAGNGEATEVAKGMTFEVPASERVPGGGSGSGNVIILKESDLNVVGTAGDDLIRGVIGESVQTVYDVQTIDGGAGIDTLEVRVAANTTNFPAAEIKNVEVFRITNNSGAATTVKFDVIEGEKEVWSVKSNSSSQTTFNGLAQDTVVGMDGGVAKLEFSYKEAKDDISLVLKNGVKQTAGTDGVKANGATATKAVITSEGAANEVGQINLGTKLVDVTVDAQTNLKIAAGAGNEGIKGFDSTATAATMTVKGAGKVDLGKLDTNLDVLDASANTGGIVAALSATGQKVTAGTGDDTLTAFAGNNNTLDAGEGKDTLIVNSAAVTAATGKLFKNFEVLKLEAASTAITVDMDHLKDTNTIGAVAVNGGTGTIGISNMTAEQAANVTVTGGANGNGAITFGIKGATDVLQKDTLKLTVDDGKASTDATVELTDPVMEGIEKLEIVNNEGLLTISTLAHAADLTDVTVSGKGGITISAVPTAGFAKNTLFDFSGMDGAVTFSAAGNTGSTAGIGIKGSLTKVNTITTGNGDDTVVGGAKNDVITHTKGGDTYILGKGGDTVTATVKGGTNLSANGLTFKFATGDSVSKAGEANGYNADLTDTITVAGLGEAWNASGATGVKFKLDTDVASGTKTGSLTAVTTAVDFGTTKVAKANDFLVVNVTDADSNKLTYVYQDTDGNGVIDAGEFAVKLAGDYSKGTFSYDANGDLTYTSAA